MVTTSFPSYEGDPSGHFILAEAEALAASGAVVTVIAPGGGGCEAEARHDRGRPHLRVERIGGGALFGWPGVMTRAAERPTRLLELPTWLLRARQAIAASGADELVAHWVFPSVWPVTAGHPFPADAVEGVSHGSDVHLLVRLPPALRHALVRAVLGRVGRWRFVSEALLAELTSALDADTARAVARVAVVQAPAVELPDVDPAARRLRASVTEEALYVVAARLVPGKGVADCLAWAARTAPVDVPTRVVVLGDGPERHELGEQARLLSSASANLRIDLLGTRGRPEALAWIAAADALLHASREEGLSTVLREAAHYGTPVVMVS